MISISLYSVPAPGQCLKGADQFLGTVRTGMHKAPLTALTAGLRQNLNDKGLKADIRIVDLQTLGSQREKYGELRYGGRTLEKFRVGLPFPCAMEYVKDDDIIGINANFTHSRRIATDFAKACKRVNRTAKVVFGGTDATHSPEYYLRNGGDIVVKGEAEATFADLVEALDRGKPLEEIANISYWSDGDIVHQASLFLKKAQSFDVESMLPPDLDAIDLSLCTDTGEGRPPFGLRGPFISVETSRGCAQACTFCATPSTKGRFRFMKRAAVKRHFEYFWSKGVRTLLFQEDNLLSRIHRRPTGEYAYPEGRQELLDMFGLAREMGFSWEFTNGLEFGQYLHNSEIDQELVDAMFWHQQLDGQHQGCYRATIPLENLSDESSRLFRKLRPLGECKAVIRALAETGVHTLSFNLIIGRPQDDETVLRLSYERCLEVRELVSATRAARCYFNVYNLSLFPGTLDYKKSSPLLAFDIDMDPEVITFYLGCLDTESFSALDITQARGSLARKLNGGRLIAEFDENRYLTHRRFDKLFS